MGRDETIYEGKTLDDAVRKGLEALGLSRAEVMITVVEEGSGGFLGLGARAYKVRVVPRPGGAIREPDSRRPGRGEHRESRGPSRDRGRDRDRGGRGERGERVPERAPERGDRRGDHRGRRGERGRDERPRAEGRSEGPRNIQRDSGGERPRAEGRPEAPRNTQRDSGGERPRVPVELAPGEAADDGRRRRRRRGGRGRSPIAAPGGPPGARPEAPEGTMPRATEAHDGEPAMSTAELEREAIRLTEELLTRMGYTASVTARAEDTRVDVHAVVPDGEHELAGRKGEVRQALQHLLNRMLNHGGGSIYHLQLEVNDFWERREEELQDLARRLADEALARNAEAVSEYLNAQERRVLHVALKTDSRVKTYALGTGLIKRVAVAPADFPEPAPTAE